MKYPDRPREPYMNVREPVEFLDGQETRIAIDRGDFSISSSGYDNEDYEMSFDQTTFEGIQAAVAKIPSDAYRWEVLYDSSSSHGTSTLELAYWGRRRNPKFEVQMAAYTKALAEYQALMVSYKTAMQEYPAHMAAWEAYSRVIRDGAAAAEKAAQLAASTAFDFVINAKRNPYPSE